jgi:hypothetical protein
MTVELVEVDIGVRWEPNAPSAIVVTDDLGSATVALRAHLDDGDQRTVVLRWSQCLAVVDGRFNDETRHLHPLYEQGLNGVLWIAEVRGSEWLESMRPAVSSSAAAGVRHFVLPLKERTIEIAARGLGVSRSGAAPAAAAVAAL